jgi:hypothetical protein
MPIDVNEGIDMIDNEVTMGDGNKSIEDGKKYMPIGVNEGIDMIDNDAAMGDEIKNMKIRNNDAPIFNFFQQFKFEPVNILYYEKLSFFIM